jgi:hypothetical protein
MLSSYPIERGTLSKLPTLLAGQILRRVEPFLFKMCIIPE